MDSASFSTPAAAPPSLLLVDDEENILAALRRLLRKDGYQILCASSGAQALEMLQTETEVDVIISDQRMPGMSGTEFLKQALNFSPHSIRIILSGYTDLESVTRAINDGAVYKFLTKPWDDELLRISIREALRQKWLQDENRMLQSMQTEIAAEFSHKIEAQQTELGRLYTHLQTLPLPLLVIDQAGQLCVASNRALELFALKETALPLNASTCLPASLEQETVIELGSKRWRCHRQMPSAAHPFELLLLSPEAPEC